MKMYILIRKFFPLGIAMVATAHASLAAYLQYEDTEEMKQWLEGKFYKTVCKVNDKEFDQAKTIDDYTLITESSLDHEEVAIAFKPRTEYPKFFKYFRLYK